MSKSVSHCKDGASEKKKRKKNLIKSLRHQGGLLPARQNVKHSAHKQRCGRARCWHTIPPPSSQLPSSSVLRPCAALKSIFHGIFAVYVGVTSQESTLLFVRKWGLNRESSRSFRAKFWINLSFKAKRLKSVGAIKCNNKNIVYNMTTEIDQSLKTDEADKSMADQ